MKRQKRLFKLFPRYGWMGWVGVTVLFLGLSWGLTFFGAEGLWFQELNYLDVLTTRLYSQVALMVIPFTLSLSVLWFNLRLAQRYRWLKPPPEQEFSGRDRPVLPGHMNLAGLLPVALLLCLGIGMILLHHGQLMVSHWQSHLTLYRPDSAAAVPLRLRPDVIWQIVQTWKAQIWQPGLIGGLAMALLLYPRWLLGLLSVLLSLSFGVILAQRWATVLLALHSVPFHQTEPLFNQDIRFYTFTLPLWELWEFWFLGLSILTLFFVSLTYLLSANSLSQGYFPGFAAAQQRHLLGLGGFLMLSFALSYWLDRYALLNSTTGAVYGATYTNVKAQLPAYTLLSLFSLLLAVVLFWQVIAWPQSPARSTNAGDRVKPTQPMRRWLSPEAAAPALRSRLTLPPFLPLSLASYGLLSLIVGVILPPTIQQFVVQPNELQLEQPYIQRTIALTRNAFNLDKINVETFNPQNSLTYADLQQNKLTVSNIRLWDTRPLLETNRQLERIRLYYEFPDADIDRYSLPTADGKTSQQQVLIAARELDYSAVPTAAQTWINQHLIYTHGYGFTLSPVNVAGEGGLPDYLVRGIEPVIIDSRVQGSIPIGKPRLYYGELTDTYVMTQTRVQELDYPSGSDNVYNVYDGRGGVAIGQAWQRLLFASHLGDWQMLFTNDFTAQTKLLFRRNIQKRVNAIAPFLRYDSNPYLVVANPGDKTWEHNFPLSIPADQTTDQSYLYWIIDAYTVNDRYPYADPDNHDFNYIRNSVKVVIDAYHGSVNFYVADQADPIIQSWQDIFPNMFQPLSAMPDALRVHIRYAPDLYRVQSEVLMTYHMTDPIVFYNREDQWRAPIEIYGNQPQLVEPYYLIMNLPTTRNQEEFVLLEPFTPVQRNNLISWLAGRSDGEDYGTMLLYTFPKQTLVFGPEQIEARINQDPIISQQISLWNRQGSSALQGNLLVIPIEQSLLYVEPLYLEAEQNRLPILARVIVVYGSRIVMAETLEAALDAVFQPPPSNNPIVRPVETGTISNEQSGETAAP